MKKLEQNQLSSINGGKNRECMILGGLATIGLMGGIWAGAMGAGVAATIYGCFS
ncbi:hypothetical protein [Fibrella aquatica]|uniref:hypothetical protein n=1 Tax=Fibrella aquatica TaxID=3242487 RepID=UPI0035221C84